VCSPRSGDEGGSRISPAAADGGLQPKLHGAALRGTSGLGEGLSGCGFASRITWRRWRHPAVLRRASSGEQETRTDRVGHGDCKQNIQREEERLRFGGDDIQTCTGMAKRKGNNETNAMVCSPSVKDERRRRKSSPELERSRRRSGKTRRSWGRRQSRRRIRVTDPITA
jgi:hypothetical protein